MLVIDDFGRQRCSVVELLNRWITPLESRTDYLTLTSGQKLPVPFVVLVVLATNIKPAELVDEAFLRRIHYKVFAESPTASDFKQIFYRCCRERGVDYDEAMVDTLVSQYFRQRGIALRGCQPRDLIDHALALADYLGEPRQLTDQAALRRVRELFPRRPGGAPGPRLMTASRRASASAALAAAILGATVLAQPPEGTTVRITSPLGRTGVARGDPRRRAGPDPGRAAACCRCASSSTARRSAPTRTGRPMRSSGPTRTLTRRARSASTSKPTPGVVVSDRVNLPPLEILEETSVSSVLVEATVQDKDGRYISWLGEG